MNRRRRSENVNGFVNFPIDNPTFTNTGEGGMQVVLVALDKYEEEVSTETWEICFGPSIYMNMSEAFVGDDKRERYSIVDSNLETIEEFFEEMNKVVAYDEYHFPYINESDLDDWQTKYGSVPYHTAIRMGTTGWSGWNEEEKHYWKCTYDDLTEDGKALYDMIKKLYGETCVLYLQTWLDT